MRAISEKIKRIEKIANKYENIRDEFIDVEKRIKKILTKLIESYAEDFKLSKSNSIRKLKFYSIVSRVKEPNSLSEKLIRNNDYNSFDIILNDIDNFDQLALKNGLKDLDDIIGIKILTDLNVDTINMYKIISSSNFIKEAEENGILLNKTDLTTQPVTMKNGLNIYKIKCQYDEWKFELQIKSKLESAWGDMEHSIFYKDYKVTPIRDLAQQSMMHIGKLLIEIDDFLQEIRSASDNFEINSKVIMFINEFEEKFSSTIREKLNGISYNVKKIASICYNLKNVNPNILDDSMIEIEYQSLVSHKYETYVKHRNEDFDLQIFEAIILSNISKPINQQNLDACFDSFFKLIKDSYVQMIIQNKLIQDTELANMLVETIFNACTIFDCKEYILNTKNIYLFIENLKIIIDAIEILEFEKEDLNQIIAVCTIHTFKGDLTAFCQTIDKDELTQNLEKSKTVIEKLKENLLIADNLTNIISLIN